MTKARSKFYDAWRRVTRGLFCPARRDTARLGRSLALAQEEVLNEKHFYEPPETCQIPNLCILYELVFGRRSNGFFVEVGAYDGITYSNSSCLAAVGWRGLLVEPVPAFAECCRKRYEENPRIDVVECAVGDSDGVVELVLADALTTANAKLAEEYREVSWAKDLMQDRGVVRVDQRRLDRVLEEQRVESGFEVLIVDVEGFESNVLAGFSLEDWLPVMMIIELCDSHPDLTATRVTDAAIARSVIAAGYDVAFKDHINTVFVRSDCWPPK